MKHLWLTCVLALNATDYLSEKKVTTYRPEITQNIKNYFSPSLAISGGAIAADIITIALSLNDAHEKKLFVPKTTTETQARARKLAKEILTTPGCCLPHPLTLATNEALAVRQQKTATRV